MRKNLDTETEFCFVGGKIFMTFEIYWAILGKNLENNGVDEDDELLRFGNYVTKMIIKKHPHIVIFLR